MAFSKNPFTENRVNASLKNILRWFHESERCVLHNNVVEIPIRQINLSNADVDELVLRAIRLREDTTA